MACCAAGFASCNLVFHHRRSACVEPVQIDSVCDDDIRFNESVRLLVAADILHMLMVGVIFAGQKLGNMDCWYAYCDSVAKE